MRQKRAKAYRRLMQTYSMFFGFRQPYQVLVDSEMCKESISHKVDLAKQLHNVVQGDVKLMITQCCIHELYLQGKAHQPAVDLAKSFERRKCNHREAIPGDECLQNVIGGDNKHRYIVATQSHSLRVNLREVPATPLVHLTRSVMILEPISDATLRAKETEEEKKLHATVPELASVEPLMIEPAKKKKGPKGPNPLSVKKKKSLVTGPQQSLQVPISTGRKRKAEDDSEHDVDEALTYSTAKRKRKRRKTTL